MYRMKIVLYFIKQPQELQEKQMNKCPVLNKWLCSPPSLQTHPWASIQTIKMGAWQFHRQLLSFLCPRSPESTPIRKIYFLGLQQIIGRLPQSSARRKKKSLRQRDLGQKQPFLGICNASHDWQDSLFHEGNSHHDGLGRKSRLHPLSKKQESLSLCLREDSQSHSSWK